jgi:hypothetical protein
VIPTETQNVPQKAFDIQIPGSKLESFTNQSPKVVGTSSYSAIKRQNLGDVKAAARNKISLDQYIKKAVIE